MNKLIFGDIEMSKKDFYEGRKAVNLSVIDVNKIVVSNKIKGNNETSKIFIVYLDGIGCMCSTLCIILPQISGFFIIFKIS